MYTHTKYRSKLLATVLGGRMGDEEHVAVVPVSTHETHAEQYEKKCTNTDTAGTQETSATCGSRTYERPYIAV